MSLTFNGHDLTTDFICGEPKRSIIKAKPTLRERSAGNGSVFVGLGFEASTISFGVTTTASTATLRREAFSKLGGWLNVDEPKQLVLPETPNWYWLAVPDGSFDIEKYIDGDGAELTFILVDPVAYGVEKTLTVPSGGSLTFTVDGTYPTKPVITASSAVRNSTALVWGLQLDSVDYVHVATGSGSSRAVAIDCDKRTCTVASAVSMITLDSDWLEFTPGSHTLAMDYGTGAATVKYRERWM